MMLVEATTICRVLLLNAIQVVHIAESPGKSAYEIGAIDLAVQVLMLCNVSAVIQTTACLYQDPPLSPSRTVRAYEDNDIRSGVLLFADVLGMFDLEALQMTCYPFAGVWCHLEDSFRSEKWNKDNEMVRQCDVFVITDPDQLQIHHLLRHQDGVKMFTLQQPENVCNKAGVFKEDGAFQDRFSGLSVKRTGVNIPVYNAKLLPARNISSVQTGHVRGFERSMIETAQHYLNFTLVDYEVNPRVSTYGLRPYGDTYWDGYLIKYLITRQVHLAFGDLSILQPRQLFIDFTFTHDVDVACFLAKIDVQPYSGGGLLELIGVPVSATYVICVIMVTVWFTIYRTGIPRKTTPDVLKPWIRRASFEFVNLFIYFSSYIVHPRTDRFKVHGVRSSCLLVLWKLGMFWMSTIFYSVLTSFITYPRIQGKCDSLMEVSSVLKTVARSRIYTFEAVKRVFDESTGESEVMHTLKRYMEVYTENDYTDAWRQSRVAFLFAESLMAGRYVWAHNMGEETYQTAEHTYNTYQAIGFQQGCVLRHQMNSVVQRLVETGHLIHYKKFGGLHLGNDIHVPFEERRLGLSSFASIFLFVGIGYGLCIVVVLIEILDNYEFNRPTPHRIAHYYDLYSLNDALKSTSQFAESPQCGLNATAVTAYHHDCGYSCEVSGCNVTVLPRCGSINSCYSGSNSEGAI